MPRYDVFYRSLILASVLTLLLVTPATSQTIHFDANLEDAPSGWVPDPDDPLYEMFHTGEVHDDVYEQPPRFPGDTADDKDRTWTILFYDDSEFPGYDPFNDFRRDAYSDESIDVILLQDTQTGPTRLWHVPGDGALAYLGSWGELSMGSANTLRDFINYGKTNYPADRYMVCVYDHGSGCFGACIDYTDSDLLTMNDFKIAITEAGGVDILAFTAPCEMGAVESVYQLRDCVDVYIGSEDLSGYALWATIMGDICGDLAASDGISTETAATGIVDRISKNTNWPDPWWTMSAIKCADMAPVTQLMDGLFQTLLEMSPRPMDAIHGARDSCFAMSAWYYETPAKVDLVSFLNALASRVPDVSVQNQIQAVKAALDQGIVAEWHEVNQTDANGLSIYFPKTLEDYNTWYETGTLDFAQDTHWDELLNAYWASAATHVAGDPVPRTQPAIAFPNPFQHTTQIRFKSPNVIESTLQVYDIAGRLVRTLPTSGRDAESVSYQWDGTDAAGRKMPSGTYFYRLESGATVQTQRLVLVR